MTTRFCTGCGAQRVEGAAFCPSCGAPAGAAQPGVGPPPPEAPAPPPMAAAPPPAPPAYPPAPPPAPAPAPAPVYHPEAKQPPWGWIIAGVVGLALLILAILYFTGVFGGSSRDGRLVGTWGAGCPADRSDVITFSSDHRFVRPGGSGTWSFSGDDLTLQLNGQRLAVGWQWIGENSARLTVPGTGRSIMQYRCN